MRLCLWLTVSAWTQNNEYKAVLKRKRRDLIGYNRLQNNVITYLSKDPWNTVLMEQNRVIRQRSKNRLRRFQKFHSQVNADGDYHIRD